jgi:hypothetical protein
LKLDRFFLGVGLALVASALIVNEWVLGRWLTSAGHITNSAARLALAVVDVGALLAGVVLIRQRARAPWRQMLLSVASMVVALTVAEGGVRIWFAARSAWQPQDRVVADTIGWRPVANLSYDRDLPAFGRIHYSTVRGGFRVFGNPASSKPKILVLGDSFTEAMMVSDGDTYYQRLAAARPDLEIFAIGAGGFGTLQEYMLLDEWIDTIRPSLVLLQMHPNDLINNSQELESRSTTNNNQMTRPYWEQGRVVSKFPENQAWGPVYNLVRHSYLLRVLNLNLHFLRSGHADSVERTLTRDDPGVMRAIQATSELLAMMQRRAQAPVAAFTVKPDGWFKFWTESQACAKAGVQFIPGVGEAVDAAERAGETVTGAPIDSHWNGRGHQIAAGVIANWLVANLPDLSGVGGLQ